MAAGFVLLPNAAISSLNLAAFNSGTTFRKRGTNWPLRGAGKDAVHAARQPRLAHRVRYDCRLSDHSGHCDPRGWVLVTDIVAEVSGDRGAGVAAMMASF
jgi:hypothetical protein